MKRKILAVDDSMMMLRIVSGAIEMLDYEPLRARNGKEAVATLGEHGNDVALVLLDWNMPEMNGFETLQFIKNDPRYKDIPVMMVTTESEKQRVVEAIKAGASHYLTKPFTPQDLATRIMECLGLGL